MPDVLNWRDGGSEAMLGHLAADLREGKLVALPTEAGYEGVVSAQNPAAMEKLKHLAGDEPLAVVLGEANEVFDWLPYVRGAGRRLMRMYWPGPLTILSSAGTRFGLVRQLPAAVQRGALRGQHLAVRLPGHDWPGPLRRLLAEPLLSAPLPGFPQEVSQIGAGCAELATIVDGGPSPFIKPPTLVQVDGSRATIQRDGAVLRADVEFAMPCHILFICTGNTCRSPLAEGLCRVLLSAKVGCAPADLSKHGFVVQSAGMAAGSGNPATAEGVAAAEPYGADLRGHCSQPLSLELLARADLVFTMTWSQLSVLRSLRPPIDSPLQLLSPSGADIDDPIGGPDDLYRTCAAQIWHCLQERLPEMLES